MALRKAVRWERAPTKYENRRGSASVPQFDRETAPQTKGDVPGIRRIPGAIRLAAPADSKARNFVPVH